jgi:hypothetical protein
MADKELFESPTGIEQDVQITERTKHAMETYFSWLQNAMSAIPWSNTNLNRILVGHATQNVTATFAFVQKSQEFSRGRQNSERVYGDANEFV